MYPQTNEVIKGLFAIESSNFLGSTIFTGEVIITVVGTVNGEIDHTVGKKPYVSRLFLLKQFTYGQKIIEELVIMEKRCIAMFPNPILGAVAVHTDAGGKNKQPSSISQRGIQI